jgi:hypothetical protein
MSAVASPGFGNLHVFYEVARTCRFSAPRQFAELSSHPCLASKERDHLFCLWGLTARGDAVAIKVATASSTRHAKVRVCVDFLSKR